jgi:hypothetical protein
MNTTEYAIETVLGTATKIRLTCTGYYIGMNSCYIKFELLSSTDQLVALGNMQMSSTDYANWGTDDNYVINWACTKLGLTRA